MNRKTEARNAKSFITTVDGERFTVLPLNGSAARFPKPWEDLSHLFKILDLPDHPESPLKPLNIDSTIINEILGIEDPTPEQEATLTAVLSGETTVAMQSVVGPVNARKIHFSLGPTPMVAALADASGINQIPTQRLLIITDRPLN